MISVPVFESRLPVGSSASRIEGSFTSARAIATRWRWPPDSSLGRCVMREPSSTFSSACFARSWRSSDWHAGVDQRQLDVVERRRARQQIERLEHEADLFVADPRQLVVVHLADLFAVQQVRALARRVEAADEIHERRLARPGRPHDGDVLAALDGNRHAAQGVNLLRAHHVGFPQIDGFNECHGFLECRLPRRKEYVKPGLMFTFAASRRFSGASSSVSPPSAHRPACGHPSRAHVDRNQRHFRAARWPPPLLGDRVRQLAGRRDVRTNEEDADLVAETAPSTSRAPASRRRSPRRRQHAGPTARAGAGCCLAPNNFDFGTQATRRSLAPATSS